MTLKTALARGRDAVAAASRRTWGAVRAHPIVSVALLPALVLAYVLVLVPFTPSIGDIKKAKLEHPTVVMSSDGKEIATFKRSNRDWVKLAEISPNVVDALIATEDRRFFEHHGMDFKRTFSALLATLHGDRQGGSTITQQLARNLYPEEVGRAPTITRKIKEAITALKIEATYTKQEILETYLNTVPFLYNAYGVDMAARTYFDKPADKLDLGEAATLVGMLKGTSYYNPVLNPERSIERRNTVLSQMVKYGKLDQAKYAAISKRPLGLDFEKLPEVAGPAPHLARQLRQWLGEWAERNGYNIYTDGLVVRTTVDSRLQALANAAVDRQMDKLQGQADARRNAIRGNRALVTSFIRDTPEFHALREQGIADADALKQLEANPSFMKAMWEDKTRLESGFLAIEPGTGYIRAWVGSRDFQQDQFDHVNQARRQPGSTFKPFVYGAAFDQGMSQMQQFPDSPVEIRIDERTVWRPKDVDPSTGQMMTLRDALAQSKNTITAQLMQQVGVDRVVNLARAMGIRQSKLDPVPSLALGTSPVTLKELVAAYGTIANNGNYVEPQLVLRIEDRNHNVLEEFQPAMSQPALSTQADQTLIDAMRAVIDNGTGVRIRNQYGITADVAGKTGTTQNDTDGWFLLMHPQLVAGAWVGFNDARVTMIHEWGQGAHSALPIVGDVFSQAFKGKIVDAKAQFAAPRNTGVPDPSLMGRVGDWFNGLFGNGAPPNGMPEVAVTQPSGSLPEMPPAPSYEPAPRLPDASIAGSPALEEPPQAQGGTAVGGGSILSLGLPNGPAARSNMPPNPTGGSGATAGANAGGGSAVPGYGNGASVSVGNSNGNSNSNSSSTYTNSASNTNGTARSNGNITNGNTTASSTSNTSNSSSTSSASNTSNTSNTSNATAATTATGRSRVVTLPSGGRAIVVAPPAGSSAGNTPMTITLGAQGAGSAGASGASGSSAGTQDSVRQAPREIAREVPRDERPAASTQRMAEPSSANESSAPTEASGSAGVTSTQ